jgi:hypothetical protein
MISRIMASGFAYLAHFCRTGHTAEEGSCARKEFDNFFMAIGYKYGSSGNFKSRWFESICVTNQGRSGTHRFYRPNIVTYKLTCRILKESGDCPGISSMF